MLRPMDRIITEFGKVVVELRKQKGWSQEKLAEESDMSVNQLSLIERGKVKPSIIMLFRLGNGFGVEPDELIRMTKNALNK